MFGLLQKNKNKDGIGYFDNKALCSICNKDLSLKTLRCRFQLADGWLCSDCIKLAGGYSNLNRKKDTIEIVKEKIKNIQKEKNKVKSINQNSIQYQNIEQETNKIKSITEEQKREILGEERYKREIGLRSLNAEYKKYTDKQFKIHEELMYSNLYSKAINQKKIFNKYSDKYIELCNQLLQLLPKTLEYDKKEAKISKLERSFDYCDSNIVNMIRLLEKQEKYNEIINVCNYLLSLGITDDGTKKGIKGRIEKAVNNFNKKNNTNYKYYSDKNLIIDDNTGEVIE